MENNYSINICNNVAEISNEFEKNNSDLKKKYYIKNIEIFNYAVNEVSNCYGTFGTGYPFYATYKNLSGKLPVINEQIRYNNELIREVEKSGKSIWDCGLCLKKNSDKMPDLKQICKSCTKMNDELKPRKVINRLPDFDMWMICDKKQVEQVKENLLEGFNKYGLRPSDIDPLRTFEDLNKINLDLKNGVMPSIYLPLDAHIIDYDTLSSLIDMVPDEIKQYYNSGANPFLPIHPWSYRKIWQKDDAAYNFIFDYLFSLTPYNFEEKLEEKLTKTRLELVNNYQTEDLCDLAIKIGSASVQRRYKSKQLQKCLEKRIEGWKK